MRYDGSGQLVCPDDFGRDAVTLDRLNARVRPLRQSGPSDGLYQFQATEGDEFDPPDPNGRIPDTGTPALPPTVAEILGSDLILDLDSDLGITLVAGAVNAWADQSGRGNSVTAPGANNRLAYALNVTDGHNAVRGTGVNDYMTGALAGLAAGAHPTVWAVVALPVAAQVSIVETSDVTGSSTRGVSLYRETTRPTLGMATGSPLGNVVVDGGGTAVRPMSLLRGSLTSGERLELYDNEMWRASRATALDVSNPNGLATAQTQISVGLLFAGAYPFNGDLFRLVISKAAPTQDQIAAMTRRLDYEYPSVGLLSSGVIFVAGGVNGSTLDMGADNPVVDGFLWDQRAVTSTTMADWQYGTAAFSALVAAINRTLSGSPAVVAWIHGEADCDVANGPLYLSRMRAFMGSVLSATGRTVFWVDVQLHAALASGTPTGRAAVRAAKSAIAATGASILLNCDDISLSGAFQWDAAGQIAMCQRIADAVETHYGL